MTTRKVRTGQKWRPPSAADENAKAAAADAYRRGPDVIPQLQAPRDMIVKVPSGGIDARDGMTIYSAWCTRCVETPTGTAGQKTLVDTTETVEVYNIYPEAVTEGVYVPTSVTIWGTRYVTGEPCV
jgi:hypothetical protein